MSSAGSFWQVWRCLSVIKFAGLSTISRKRRKKRVRKSRMKKETKLKMREKIAFAAFMEAVPKIIDLWKKNAPEKTFDEFLLEKYVEGKGLQNKNK